MLLKYKHLNLLKKRLNKNICFIQGAASFGQMAIIMPARKEQNVKEVSKYF